MGGLENTCALLLEKSKMLDASFFCASVPGGSLSGKGSELPAEKVRRMQSSMYGTERGWLLPDSEGHWLSCQPSGKEYA